MDDQKAFELTADNYYGEESNWHLMSVSQYKRFERCEAAALAELKGEWKPERNIVPLLVGNYVHSYFESEAAHEAFKEENKQHMFKDITAADIKAVLDKNGAAYKKSANKSDLYKAAAENGLTLPRGDLLAPYVQAETLISTLKKEPLFNYLWQGEKEVMIEEELFGVKWKAKIDLLNIDKGYFIDLKTAAQLDGRYWSNKYGSYVSFIEQYGYTIQVAIYEKLLEIKYGKPFKGYIYAVTKQDPPDVAAIKIEERKLQFEYDLVEENIERVQDVKTGKVKPTGCGKCDYCRSVKKLDRFINSDDLLL